MARSGPFGQGQGKPFGFRQLALLDAKWLVDFAASRSGTANSRPVISRRQEVPAEAFLSYDDIISYTQWGDRIRIIAVNHMWLHPSYPDPKGTTLHLLANKCRKCWKMMIVIGGTRRCALVYFGISRRCTNMRLSQLGGEHFV